MSTNSGVVAQVPTVEIEGGPITLEQLGELIARQRAADTRAIELRRQAERLHSDARVKRRDAAAILVAQRDKWNTTDWKPRLLDLDAAISDIDSTDAALLEVTHRYRKGFKGFVQRFGDRNQRVQLMHHRNEVAAKVNAQLVALGEAVKPPTIPVADSLLSDANRATAATEAIEAEAAQINLAVQRWTAEIKRRQEGTERMGFDALYTAAWLQDHEPAPVDSPVALRRDEVAWLLEPTTLARMTKRTQWTGSSQGVSFPIGHTGIRYRVGSYKGHPVQTQVLANLDAGSLILTNQRLIFVGKTKTVTVNLSKVVHVEAYTDALAVFHESRETPDFFRLRSPQYFLFYLNYALGRAGV